MKKYLPIKFYQRREEIDDRFTPGMGGGELPNWVLSGEELKLRSESLTNSIEDVIHILENRQPQFDYIPSIISVELENKAIAKSHRASIKEIFNEGRAQNIIGFNNENELLIKISSVQQARIVKQKVHDFNKYAKGVSSITEIDIFKPIISSYDFFKEGTILKASLFNYYDYNLNQAVKNAFDEYCRLYEIIPKETYYADDLIIFRLDNVNNQEQFTHISSFPALQYLSPMPKIKIGFHRLDDTASIPVKLPESGKSYPIVGVLDSGMADVPHLSPWIDGSYSSYPENYLDRSHGTFIGGIITYGDELENKEIVGINECKVFDAAILPDTNKEYIQEDELIENIREVIQSHTNIHIWNLSIGYEDLEINENNFSQFAIALDSIQKHYDVIICKSAGNCSNFQKGKPVGKITVPSESILSLVVGSVSNVGTPSVFSRIGHGPASIHKPDLTSYGGDFSRNNGTFLQEGVKSFDLAGNIIEAVGTSFSTPRVATLLAGLEHEINEEFDPLLLKALTIHSSKYPHGLKLNQVDRVKMLGYGIPDNLKNIIYNTDNEITLIQSDRLIKGKYLEILEFPFPESLVNAQGYFYGDITITLVTSPVLFGGNGAEYCQSDIDVKFGTFDEIKDLEVTRARKNEYGPDELQNLLLPDKYGTRYLKNSDSENPFVRERTLLKYGKKYHPVKKWHVDLSELTPAKKDKILKAPKKWGLRLNGLYRDFAETRAGIDGEQLYQDFCLIITIKDPNNEKPIYNEVTQLLENRNFIHNDIRLRENILEQVRV